MSVDVLDSEQHGASQFFSGGKSDFRECIIGLN